MARQIKETVAKFCFWKPTLKDIDSLKGEGNWNNDWDVSMELIKRHIHSNKLSIQSPSKTKLRSTFDDLYFGGSSKEDPCKWTGFIKNETQLVDKQIFEEIENQKLGWGFVSGAERASAKFILESRIGLKNPPLIAMGEAPEKPDPTGIIRLSEQLLSQPLGLNSPPIAYLGDTVADVLTIQRASKKIPSQKFISLAIAPPHLHNEQSLDSRLQYERQLKEAGANEILNSSKDVINFINMHWEKI